MISVHFSHGWSVGFISSVPSSYGETVVFGLRCFFTVLLCSLLLSSSSSSSSSSSLLLLFDLVDLVAVCDRWRGRAGQVALAFRRRLRRRRRMAVRRRPRPAPRRLKRRCMPWQRTTSSTATRSPPTRRWRGWCPTRPSRGPSSSSDRPASAATSSNAASSNSIRTSSAPPFHVRITTSPYHSAVSLN